MMTIQETAIAKIQQLPDSLVQETINFIDLITRDRQAKTTIDSREDDRLHGWATWFEATDRLETRPEHISITPSHEYQQRLLNKYRQQGLNL